MSEENSVHRARQISARQPHASMGIGANNAPVVACSWRGIGCRDISERVWELRGQTMSRENVETRSRSVQTMER
jgi:hypothetical protein